MKKLISLLIVLATILSLCACTSENEAVDTNAATTATENTGDSSVEPTQKEEIDYNAPEIKYAHINQLEPTNGVYQVWSEIGVQNMADHPDATFEILCNIEMKGAVVRPIGTAEKPFTGEINGNHCTISDFTIQGSDETDFGFIGVNEGIVQNLFMRDVTMKVGDNVQNVGGFAGVNNGEISRCAIYGTDMEVHKTSGPANCGVLVGVNNGELINNVSDVDIVYTAPAAAKIGGIAGVYNSGKLEYNESYGALTVTGQDVTTGMFFGEAKDLHVLGCWFVGEDNSVNGKLFTNFAGKETNVTYENCLWRDNDIEPLPENVRKLRQKVVDTMYEMGTIDWHVTQNLTHNCKCGTSGVCVGVYNPINTYVGMPYKHGSGSLTSFKYCLNEDGSLKDWMYEMDEFGGYDVYIGSMCASATEMAWWSVSNSVDHLECREMLPDRGDMYGCIPVGEGWWEDVVLDSTGYSIKYHENTTKEIFFNALAQVRMGDCMTMNGEDGAHVVMAATDAVIIRDQEGVLSGESFFLTHEQQGGWLVDSDTKTYTSWRLNYKRTFNSYWHTTGKSRYVPVTCEELLTGEMETPECALLDGADGFLGMTVGTVKANYFLDAVELKVMDSEGNLVVDRMLFPKAGKPQHANTRLSSLSYIDNYDMANFCTPLQNITFQKGETYTYTVSGYLATGDVFELKTDSFIYGSAS